MGLENFKKIESIKSYFDTSYGFVVFPHVAKGGFGFGGAAGKGDVFVNNKDGTETKVGSSFMGQFSFGFQLGGQVYSEIIFFESEKDMDNSKQGRYGRLYAHTKNIC